MPETTYLLLLSVGGGDVEHARLILPLLDDAVGRVDAEHPQPAGPAVLEAVPCPCRCRGRVAFHGIEGAIPDRDARLSLEQDPGLRVGVTVDIGPLARL